ncbi:MAG: hypothetical protein VYD81_06850, partial [Planctomycetota bacterium]|nr:hypothetical protein [Planctomycetota bacterium]
MVPSATSPAQWPQAVRLLQASQKRLFRKKPLALPFQLRGTGSWLEKEMGLSMCTRFLAWSMDCLPDSFLKP